MEPWQKLYIRKTGSQLYKSTIGNKSVLVALVGKNHLFQSEFKKLLRVDDREGDDDQAADLYSILQTRIGAYNDLIEILEVENQTEPVKILKTGLRLYELIKATTRSRSALAELRTKQHLTASEHDKFVGGLNSDKRSVLAENLFTILVNKVSRTFSFEDLIELLNQQISEPEQNTEPVVSPTKKQNLKRKLEPEDQTDQNGSSFSGAVPTGPVSAEALDSLYKSYIEKEIRNPLNVKVERPKACMRQLYQEKDNYNLPNEGKGWALIINIVSYEKTTENGKEIDPTRHGGEHDGRYMRELWKQLGYKIFREDEIDWVKGIWNYTDVIDLVDDFQKLCNKKGQSPNSVVIFIGGHGMHNKVITSDLQKLDLYADIVRKFYHGVSSTDSSKQPEELGCPGLKGKPKIILVNACQIFETQQGEAILETPVSDMLVCTAQVPGFRAWRSNCRGSWFAHCLTYVFMKFAKEKSVQELLRLVSQYLKNVEEESVGKMATSTGELVPLPHGQVPEIRDKGLDDLYFFMPAEK